MAVPDEEADEYIEFSGGMPSKVCHIFLSILYYERREQIFAQDLFAQPPRRRRAHTIKRADAINRVPTHPAYERTLGNIGEIVGCSWNQC